MGWAWGGVIIMGIVTVALAVGIPYFLTHRRMREHHDVSDSRYYLRARRKSRLHRRGGSTAQGPGSTEPMDTTPPESSEPTSGLR